MCVWWEGSVCEGVGRREEGKDLRLLGEEGSRPSSPIQSLLCCFV